MVQLSGCYHFNPIKFNITSNGRQDLKGEEVSQCVYAVLGTCSLQSHKEELRVGTPGKWL